MGCWEQATDCVRCRKVNVKTGWIVHSWIFNILLDSVHKMSCMHGTEQWHANCIYKILCTIQSSTVGCTKDHLCTVQKQKSRVPCTKLTVDRAVDNSWVHTGCPVCLPCFLLEGKHAVKLRENSLWWWLDSKLSSFYGYSFRILYSLAMAMRPCPMQLHKKIKIHPFRKLP